MRWSQEAKVGLITVLATALLVLAMSYTNRSKQQESRDFHLLFSGVDGLLEQAQVQLAGVRVGYVQDLQFEEDQSVRVTVRILRPEARFYREHRDGQDPPGSFFTYTINGNSLGDRWVEIIPGRVPAGEPALQAGATVQAQRPMTLNELHQQGHQVLSKLDRSVDSLSLLASDSEQGGLRQAVRDFQETSSNLRKASNDTNLMVSGLSDQSERLSDSLETVATKVEQNLLGLETGEISSKTILEKLAANAAYRNSAELTAMVMNLNDTAFSVKKALRAVEQLSDSKPLNEEAVSAVKDLRDSAEDIQGIAMDLRHSQLPPGLQRELRSASANSKIALASAARILGRVDADRQGRYSDTILPSQTSDPFEGLEKEKRDSLVLKPAPKSPDPLLDKYLFPTQEPKREW